MNVLSLKCINNSLLGGTKIVLVWEREGIVLQTHLLHAISDIHHNIRLQGVQEKFSVFLCNPSIYCLHFAAQEFLNVVNEMRVYSYSYWLAESEQFLLAG